MNHEQRSKGIGEQDESLLMIRLRTGDRRAFNYLIEKYQGKVTSLVQSLAIGWVEPEEIVEEVFMRAFRESVNYCLSSRFDEWLYKIVLTVIEELLPTTSWGGSENEVARIDEAALMDSEPHRTCNLILSADSKKIASSAIRLLSVLPLDYRAAIVLREVVGFNYMEISNVLSCSVSEVGGKIFRAREMLSAVVGFKNSP